MRALLLLATFLAACASPPGAPPPGPGEVPSVADALGFLKRNQTREEVRGLLGEPQAAIAFDSGYEVWVYRQQLRDKQEPPRAELVVLFSNTGTLSKIRVRDKTAPSVTISPWPSLRSSIPTTR